MMAGLADIVKKMSVVIRTKLPHNVRTKIAPPVGSAQAFLSLLQLGGCLVEYDALVCGQWYEEVSLIWFCLA